MKRFLVVLPVVIALLTFGISVKSMAQPVIGNDVLVPIDESIAVNDTLNGNEVDVKGNNTANDDAIIVKDTLNDNELEDIANDKSHNNGEAEVERANHVANANNGSVAKVYEDNSINIKDIAVAIANSDLNGAVVGAALVGVPLFGGEIERSFNTGDNILGSRGSEVELNGVANISQNTGNNSLVQQSNTFNASVR